MQETINEIKDKPIRTKASSSLEKTLVWIFSGLFLLLPIFFIPNLAVPILFIKYGLLALATVAIVTVWILLRLKDGLFILPVNKINLAGLAVLVVVLISSLFSGSIWNSLFGQLGQTDTFFFYLYVFLIMFMIPIVFNSTKRILNLYKILIIPMGLLAIFHFIRLFFGASFLSFGYFPSITDNLLGKWNDLGIFFGLGVVLSLATLELFALKNVYKYILYVSLAVLMVLLAVVNFTAIWYVLGVISIIFFVHSLFTARSNVVKKTDQVALSVAPLVIFLISTVFIIAGARIGDKVSSYLNITQVDVVPTWQATTGIAKGVVMSGSPIRFVFGAGPNRFVNEWNLFKPSAVNSSIYWNTDFNSGVGLIPSSAITTGLLGLLAWIVFLGLFVYVGFRSILSYEGDDTKKYIIMSSFFVALYLWVLNIFYVPSLVIIVLTFLFSGVFVSSLYVSGLMKFTKLEYFKNPKIGFASVFALIMIFIFGLALIYTIATKFVAVAYYNRGLVAINQNDLDLGEQNIKSALSFDNSDLYMRAVAQIYLVRLNLLVSGDNSSVSVDKLKEKFSVISSTALSAAQIATSLDGSNYQNWLTMGDVWSALVPFKFEKSYDNALVAYQKALNYNPQNPYVYLQLAKLDTVQKDAVKAKGDLVKAFNLKRDYTDAYLFLAQLQMNEGDVKAATDSLVNATISSPSDYGIFFQLGALRYENKDYKNAVDSFEKAVILNNQYSNAKYFLGLSYYQVGRTSDAIAQFEDLQKLNPGNQEIITILNNLKSGKAPIPKAVMKTSATTTPKK